ncbi:MAG TPA: PAS domain S-box protein [Xanthobacteraceae bacterium]|nr:PAS domain S-box protein [Xanthobacteraceae bacterium]
MDQSESRSALPHGEASYGLLINAVRDYAIYMLDRDGVVTSWNTGAQNVKGYAPADIIGSHFSRFYTEDDQARGLPAKALATSAREGKFEAEGWRVKKDGSRFWAHVLIDPIRTPEGELIGFAKVTRDLTERMLAEEALRRSQEQFRLLVQSVIDYSIYMIDPTGRITSWNLGAKRIKGYAPEEIIGDHFSRFYTPEDRQNGEPARALDIAGREGRFEKEGWRLRKDGSRFWAHVVIDAIRAEDGTLLGFAKVTRDITERRETQRALERSREALFQSQKMEAIGQLTGGVAHDFNNLLMVVLGSLELMRKRLPDDARTLALLDNAIQGARRGSALTQRMLAFARRQELTPVPVGVPQLVQDMSELLQRSLGPSVPIDLRFPLLLDDVLADPGQIELAVLNLAVNARDAMPSGGTILIGAREETVAGDHPTKLPPGRYVALAVTDTGEGMNEATLARAVEPFFTTKGIGKGTGLGLSMVHGIAEQSGGRLVLKSRPGQGTSAEIWLPVVDSGPDRCDAPSPRDTPAEAAPLRLKVLAVDDDPLVLMNTAAMLEELGHAVLEASSAKEALVILQADDGIDLIVTDQAMPHMTGTELAEAARRWRPDLPIVIATGYAELPGGIASRHPKLAKPFTERDLATIIAEVQQAAKGGTRL